ncbi:hypothetical protein C8F01DRAFT_1249462 [Mycena amicta]|nr:hypothetical protein C8F01DRAFT_1249462 [Mycena amicta]
MSCVNRNLPGQLLIGLDDLLLPAIFEVQQRLTRPGALKVQPMGLTPACLAQHERHKLATLFTQAKLTSHSTSSAEEWLDVYEQIATTALASVRTLVLTHQLRTRELAWWFQTYGMLFSSWSRVKLTKVEISGTRQFGLTATTDIPRGTQLWEVCGVLSCDGAKNSDHTELSTIVGMDRLEHILSGPLRFINHRCTGTNTEFIHVKDTLGMIVTTTTLIKQGQELTLHYGPKYFSSDFPCLGPCCPSQPADPAALAPAPVEPRSEDKKRARERERKHEQRRRKKLKSANLLNV